jgi:hypothetical protein
MACYTQEEIAEKVGMTQQAVALVLQQSATLGRLQALRPESMF